MPSVKGRMETLQRVVPGLGYDWQRYRDPQSISLHLLFWAIDDDQMSPLLRTAVLGVIPVALVCRNL